MSPLFCFLVPKCGYGDRQCWQSAWEQAVPEGWALCSLSKAQSLLRVANFGHGHQSTLTWKGEEVAGQEIRVVPQTLGLCRKPREARAASDGQPHPLGCSRNHAGFCLRPDTMSPCLKHGGLAPSIPPTRLLPCPWIPNACWISQTRFGVCQISLQPGGPHSLEEHFQVGFTGRSKPTCHGVEGCTGSPGGQQSPFFPWALLQESI